MKKLKLMWFKFLGGDLLESKRLILNRQMDTILVSDCLKIFLRLSVDVSNKESGDNIFKVI